MNGFTSKYGEVHAQKAITENDYNKVNQFREIHGTVNSSMEESFLEKEFIRDQIGVVLTYSIDDVMVASLRYVPLGQDISVVESVFSHAVEEEGFNLPTWEGGRFVVHPNFRGHGLFKDCLANSMEWLRDNTMCQNIIAPIRKKLLPLYERYTFYPIASESVTINDENIEYLIITSSLISVLNRTVFNGYKRTTPKYLSLYKQELNKNPQNKSILTR